MPQTRPLARARHLASALLLLGTITTTATAPAQAALTPTPDPALLAPGTSPSGAPVPRTAARGLQLGAHTNVSWRDFDKLSQELDLIQRAGVTWIRVDVSWASLQEHNKDSYSQWYVNRLDRIAQEASRRGIKVLGTLMGAPSWVPVKENTRYGIPRDGALIEGPARFLAQRYAGRIDAWQVWNEPDCDTRTCSTVDPGEYLPLLRSAYRGLKAGSPRSTVVAAGVSGIDPAWLRRLYATGAKDYFDVLALHPYVAPANGSPRLAPVGTNPYRMTNTPAAVAVMKQFGDEGTPIWFTEFGWTTGRQAGSYDGVDETTQAYYLRDAAILVNDNYPQVTNMFWYAFRDRNDSNVYENNFGLVRTDGTPKAAYWSFREAAAFLR